MVRPVGSRVSKPAPGHTSMDFPWCTYYRHEWTESGTSALALAIGLAINAQAVAGPPEVILPAYGCPDLVAAVLFHGARPVLVDLSPGSPHMDPAALEKAIGINTVAVVAISFLGLGEGLRALRELLRGTSVWLIEDSAQAFPPASSMHGIADCVVLSFGRGKPINLMGGGALLIHHDHSTQASKLLAHYPPGSARQIDARWHLRRHLFNLLLTPPLYGLLVRLPFLGIGATRFHPLERITREGPVEAAFWGGVDAYRSRPDWSTEYRRALGQAELNGWLDLTVDRWQDAGAEKGNAVPCHLLRYPLLAPDRPLRDLAVGALNRAGYGANAFYNQPLPEIPGLEQVFGASAETFPNACDFSGRLITLPSHQDVCERDIHRIVKIIGEANAAGYLE